jgi:hypothetical protein
MAVLHLHRTSSVGPISKSATPHRSTGDIVSDTSVMLHEAAQLEQAVALDNEYLWASKYEQTSDEHFVDEMFRLDDTYPNLIGYVFH